MFNIKYLTLFIVLCFVLSACKNDPVTKADVSVEPDPMNPVYANGFRIEKHDGIRKIVIMNPWSPGNVLQEIILMPDSIPLKKKNVAAEIIHTPVNEVIALSATQWAGFEKLSALECIAGITEADFVQSPDMKYRIQQGDVIDVGRHGVLKPELILNLQADLVLFSPESSGIPSVLDNTGLPLLAWPDYYETDPRGRAEWIKLVGILIQKEDKAKSLFDSIVTAYNCYKSHAVSATDKPNVMADKAFSGQWYIPGGESYMATFFAHAGAAYLWADIASKASVPLDLETILHKASYADFWRIAHAAPQGYSLSMLVKENPLYAAIKPFREGTIIFCNTSYSGYFEKGIYEPHFILADLIYFFHPGLLQDYTPVYHELLK
jgi:iron complex transport system substrate-binding protein